MPLDAPSSDRKRAPHRKYHAADGSVVPSVTTVLGIIDKPALLRWAWKQGLAGVPMAARWDAADIGTAAHAMVSAHFGGEKFDRKQYKPSHIKAARGAFANFLKWAESHDIEPLHIEIPLVSDRGYGGTVDFIGFIEGELEVVDWKFAAGIYPEHFMQLSAYRELYWQFDATQEISGVRVVRIDKVKDGGFTEQFIEDTDPYYRVFLSAHRTWNELDRLRRYRKGKQDEHDTQQTDTQESEDK